MEITDPRIYRIQSEPCHFYTGHLKDGTSVFMSVFYPNLVAVLFDTEGRLIKPVIRDISQMTQAAFRKAVEEKQWHLFHQDWEELDDWASELGLIDGVIAVQKFSLPEFNLRIQDLPSIYQELLNSGEELDEDTKEQIQYWQEELDYVLVWGNEYDMNSAGEVVST